MTSKVRQPAQGMHQPPHLPRRAGPGVVWPRPDQLAHGAAKHRASGHDQLETWQPIPRPPNTRQRTTRPDTHQVTARTNTTSTTATSTTTTTATISPK